MKSALKVYDTSLGSVLNVNLSNRSWTLDQKQNLKFYPSYILLKPHFNEMEVKQLKQFMTKLLESLDIF